MGIFGINYDKPGPGVNKDEPEKKGFRRLFELLRRELASLVMINVILLLFLAPSVALFAYNFLVKQSPLLLVVSILLALPVGGAITASFYCISIMLLNDIRHMIHELLRKYKENVIQSAFVGVIYISFFYLQVYVWAGMFEGTVVAGLGSVVLMIISLIYIGMVAPYVFLQIGHLELKTRFILKNSVLFAIRYFFRSFAGMILSLVHWLISIIFYP
ncbi:MAG: hypothetical protein FWG21_06925, partial [Oscillospiraceae bacterium]|nr:hypothetical protein [Oscillospiraceae bacterium]